MRSTRTSLPILGVEGASEGCTNMLVVGAEKLSFSIAFLEKETFFIKILLVVVHMMLGDHTVRFIHHGMHFFKKIILFCPN